MYILQANRNKNILSVEFPRDFRHRGSSEEISYPQHCPALAEFVLRWSSLKSCLSRVDLLGETMDGYRLGREAEQILIIYMEKKEGHPIPVLE